MVAVAKRFGIEFDVSSLDGLLDTLQFLDLKTTNEMARDAVNVVALTVNRKSVDDTIKQLNLTRDYVESKLQLDPAKPGSSRATVKSQVQGATLQRFGIRQETTGVRYTNERILAEGHQFGRWPGWTERMGDPTRRINPNEKQHGISVDVNRKGAKRIATAFTLPLNRGKEKGGNGLGVFRRVNGKITHLYGPSVYQTFRRYVQENEQNIKDSLRDEFIGRLDVKLSEMK